MTEEASPAPAPERGEFDADFWKVVNAALDEALECDERSRPNFMRELTLRNPRIANEVRRLLGRAHAQTLATAIVRPPGQGLTTQLAPLLGSLGGDDEQGFDGLLQRALRAERAATKNTRYPGERCGAWQLEEIIGVGGMGEVWLAARADGLYQAKAAVKFLRTDGDSVRFEARFAQERALLARLNHPGIARLIDAGRLFGQPFLVLEYVEGVPLLNYVIEHAATVESRIQLIREIGEAVTYAHTQLVVHRDLKPSNVLVTADGHVKLLDFGVAGLLDDADHDEATESAATKIAGRGLTVEYAAPEQISGEATGVVSDVYSLGSVAFHLLSGRRAHLPEKSGRAALEHAALHITPMRVSEAARSEHRVTARDNIPPPIDPLRLAGDVDAIIARAMRIDPLDRYHTMEAMVADLQRWSERRPIAARREDRSYRSRLWLRRNWLPVGLATTLVAALCAGLAISLWQYDRARAEASRANRTADYLVELLGRADPDLHGGKWPSALDLLDDAARGSGERFRNEPETEERLTRLFAKTYRSLSRDGDALPLAQRAFDLSKQLHGDSALPTLRAQSLLAWVQYWSDDYAAALRNMEPVVAGLGKKLKANEPEMLDTQLRYANILAGVYRIPESEQRFIDVVNAYSVQPEGTPDRAWKIADAEGDLAAAYTRAARWQEALDLLRKHSRIYANPPANDIKTALNHQGNLITVQNVLGDPTDVEATIRGLIDRWQTLAGEKSERIDELLNDLGLYYLHSGQGSDALATFVRIRDRLPQRAGSDASDRLRVDLDIVEVKARFNLEVPEKLIAETAAIAAGVMEKIPPTHQRFRQVLLRCASVTLALQRKDLAQMYTDAARTRAQDRSLANEARLDQVQAYLARATGDHESALALGNRRIQRLQDSGERVSLRRGMAHIDQAYQLVLAGGNARRALALQSLDLARAALPASLPPAHRAFRQMEYVDTLIRHGRDSPEAARILAQLAPLFGRKPEVMPDVLLGFYVHS